MPSNPRITSFLSNCRRAGASHAAASRRRASAATAHSAQHAHGRCMDLRHPDVRECIARRQRGTASTPCGCSASTTASGASAWRCRTRPDCWRRRGRRSRTTANVAVAARRLAAEIRALAADDDGLGAIVIGLPRRLDGEPNDQTARVQKLAQLLAARGDACRLCCRTSGSRSHEAESLLAARERDWRKRKDAARRDGRGGDPAGLSSTAGHGA